MDSDVEPIAAALWFGRIEVIARGQLGSAEGSLRHAAHLLQLTPRPFRPVVHFSVDEDAFEALLEARELHTAARHLAGQPAALSGEHHSSGPFRAVISCAILKRTIAGQGETVATAILDAWTTCLLALRTEFGADLLKLTDQVPRTAQSAQQRRSSKL